MIFNYGVTWHSWAIPLSFWWDTWHDGKYRWFEIVIRVGPLYLSFGNDEE